jgi:Lipocalin-like domain
MSRNRNLVGTWKLQSCVLEDLETKEQKPVWGVNPNGYIVMTPEGRWIVIQTAEDRSAPQNDEDRIAAFKSLLAYSGKYRTEGNKVIIDVDIAADESWNGSEQVRFYKIIGDELHIEAAPQRYANFGDRVMRGILVWKKE